MNVSIYDQEIMERREIICMTRTEAKALLHLFRHTHFVEPCCTKFAAEFSERLMDEGIR